MGVETVLDGNVISCPWGCSIWKGNLLIVLLLFRVQYFLVIIRFLQERAWLNARYQQVYDKLTSGILNEPCVRWPRKEPSSAVLCVAEICVAEICVEVKHVNQSQKKRRENKHQNHLPTSIIHHEECEESTCFHGRYIWYMCTYRTVPNSVTLSTSSIDGKINIDSVLM